MADISLEKVAGIMLAVVAVIVLIMILFTNNPLKSGLNNILNLGEKNQIGVVELNENIPFFNDFVKDYSECKLSPSTNCYCSFTYPDTSDKYILEIVNNADSKKTTLRLYSNAEISDCGSISPRAGIDKVDSTEKVVENDLLYFENVLTSPSVKKSETIVQQAERDFGERPGRLITPITKVEEFETPRFVISDFIAIFDPDRLYLYRSELCSSKDVTGSDDINFEKGAIYKFDQEKTALVRSNSQLKQCDKVPGIIKANEEFNALIEKINSCTAGPCSYPISIEKDFEISIENNNIVLKYKNKEIKSSTKINKQFCRFNHFAPSLREETQLTSLNLKDYLQLDIYPFENKVCFLPYDTALARERQIAQLRSTSSLVPDV